jgi:ribosome biogenesis GTPase
MDLVEEGGLAGFCRLYQTLGYTVIPVSARTGAGLGELGEQLRGRTSLFAGPSGAGKSTCLNAIHPGLSLRTGEVKDTGGGRHTTTHVSLLALPGGGFVVDTPGVREFGLWNVVKGELGLWYPEFASRLGKCRFPGCSHVHEPQCAIREAVAHGDIDTGRYQRYLRILELWDEPQAW